MHITVNSGKITVNLAQGMERLNSRLAELHKNMGAALLLHIQKGFEEERAPNGTQWQPLAKSTVTRRGNAGPILRVKGRLSRLYFRANRSGATIGSNLAYAPIHQFGGEIEHKAGTVKLHFRKVNNGGVRFTRKNDNRARYGMKATVGPYTIRIPARPYLFNQDGSIPETWMQSLQHILQKALGEAYAQSHTNA